jgi:short subunit dehydrogenase-like uncharacterized protein
MKPQYQIVVFGATSFVGQILCRYLFERYGAAGEVVWAMAGRSESKLQTLRSALGEGAGKLPLIIADAADEAAMTAMCQSTRVVVSTVGPYALYGSLLVKACAETGTDYCDLTGEVQWISRMIAAHEATAKKTGARIVHCCGFDSIPSDLGVHFLQQQAQQRFGEPCRRVRMGVRTLRGGFSGGTVASLMNAVQESVKDPAVRKLMANPYAVCPGEGAGGVRQPNVSFAEYDADARSWLAPFVMAAINTRIVHRSNALSGHAYGREFQYDEATMTGAGFKGRARAMGMAAGLSGFVTLAVIPPTRWLLEKFVVPKPGEGPSPEAQENGGFDLRFTGKTAGGKMLRVKVTGKRDPGYGCTSRMLGEAAACLALDLAKDDLAGGFWTPATALGDRLIPRLTAHADLTFAVLD